MSKRSLGSVAARKKGQAQHKAEREVHRAKVRAKAEREANEKEQNVISSER